MLRLTTADDGAVTIRLVGGADDAARLALTRLLDDLAQLAPPTVTVDLGAAVFDLTTMDTLGRGLGWLVSGGTEVQAVGVAGTTRLLLEAMGAVTAPEPERDTGIA